MSLVDDILSLFPDGKVSDKYIRIRCPYHKNGAERHPSMSILLEEKDKLEPGFAKCFTCSWTGTFTQIAEDFGLQYIPDTYTLAIKETPTFQLTTQQAVYKKDTPYRFSPYLASRGISEDVQRQFRIYDKPEEEKVYLPVFNKEGQFLYANARATNKKMFFVAKDCKKELAYVEGIDFGKPVAIVESQINALTLYSAQYCRAVATLGVTNISALSAIKDAIGPFLLMFDGDDYGRKATKQALDYLGAHRCIVYTMHEKEDVNDLWKACNFDSDLFYDELEKRKQSNDN